MDQKENYICNRCKHLRPLSGGCNAFPDGIPFDMGVFIEHFKPLPEQKNKIVFEEGEPMQF